MADLTAIRNALGAQITKYTGLRADPQARDAVNPPVAVILPGIPFVQFGATLDSPVSAMTLSLAVVLIISDAPPVEKSQRALDAYLGLGPGETDSIAAAIMADTSLGGTCEWCEPVSVSQYGRIEYSGIVYFGARISLTLGAT